MKKSHVKPLLFVGIDPGSRFTGYAAIERGSTFTLVAHGTISPPRSSALPRRIYLIYEQLRILLEAYSSNYRIVVGLETPFSGAYPAAFAALSNIRGALFVLFENLGVPFEDLSPAEIKRALCGSGAGAKWSIELVLKRLFPCFNPSFSDECDALAIALCVAWKYRIES